MVKVSSMRLDRAAGELIWYDGGLIAFKATGEETAGALLLIEAWMPRGKATPLHAHVGSDETFYVIDGEVVTHVGGEGGEAGPGDIVRIPRNTAHAFAVRSESARLLVMFTPACRVTEAFFRAAGEPALSPTLPPAGQPDLQRMIAAAKATGLTVLGPPPFSATVESQATG